jgi:superfamily II DNA or RNA helicase
MRILGQIAGELHRSFDAPTLRRAAVYSSDGSVATPDLQALEVHRVQATAQVRGTGTVPYTVVLHVQDDMEDGLVIRTTCTCPVHSQCKHGAALALVLSRTFARAAAPTWREAVEELVTGLQDLAPPPTNLPGVALQFSLTQARNRYGASASGDRLRVRPLRPGAKKGWARTGLGWSDVTTALVRRTYDVEQLRVLDRMHSTLMAHGGYWFGGLDPDVGDFGRPLVGLLTEARAAGVTFVALAPLLGVDVDPEPAAVVADVSAHDDLTTLRIGVSHHGRLWAGKDVTTYGEPAHSIAFREDQRILVARLEQPLTGAALRILAGSAPVSVPADDLDELDDVLRRLSGVLVVGSHDGSVKVPDRLLPVLRVTVTWSSADHAAIVWAWVYGEHVVEIGTATTVPGGRDRGAEEALLARVQPVPQQARDVLLGVDALHLALLELPAWRLVEDLEVVEIDAPDFREADEGPQITFSTPGAEEGDLSTDWLDLTVEIQVEGESVPLALVLAALTLGQEFVVLPSGLYLRTDRPEFAALDDVVHAAAQLHESTGAAVRVGRHDLGLWAQLDDLGLVDAQAAEWVNRARALRDLTELPRPEPVGVVSTLRDYQRDGFHWLAFLWQHRLGGILADEMGLGKTLQVLALVAHVRATAPGSAPFLVVAPTSVVSAWASEAVRHTPGLRVRTVTSTSSRRTETLADLAADADVVVTTYTLLRLEAVDYAAVSWGGLVLDEAQWIKNHQSKAYAAVRSIDAPFRLAVTGTPFENRLLELWSLLSVVTPGLYPQPRSFVTHVVNPVERNGDAAALRRFTRRIKPFVLRRSKELVAAELPAKQEQVLEVELSPTHRRLYDAHLARERQRILGLVENFDQNRVAILAALTKLRQLALDPALVDTDHDRVGSAKIDVLVEQLREISAEGHRALVFSTFTGFLGRVRARLEQESIATDYLDGATQRRGEVIEKFRTGDAPVFLISLKAGGVGLTLTEADYVFVLDPWWNPAAEAQAVDRAHRIGQHRTVMVYRLVSTGTIEEKVMALKARKAALFAQVIDGEAGLSASITASDIRALFD